MILGVAVATLAVLTWGGALAPASTPAPPVNDGYLNSLELNAPGSKLNDTDTLKDVRNTASATVQTNIFDPCGRAACPNGPAEVTSCRGVNYGNTVWYDFYPNVNGNIEIRTSGYDNVITLYPFSLKTALPNAGKSTCVHANDFPSEQMLTPVKKGQNYTVQIGSVSAGGGPLEVLFDFFATPPHRLTAQTTLKAKQITNGLQLLGLSVSTARAAKVTVTCGRFCHSQSASDHGTEKFPHLNGVQMPAGSNLKIFVTAPHSIGAYIDYGILNGNFTKTTRCLEPGSRKPRKTCH
jgi:hypothetical protein